MMLRKAASAAAATLFQPPPDVNQIRVPVLHFAFRSIITRMSTASKYTPHYTIADYEQWPGDWELWQGTAVAMTPSPFGRHQFVLVNLVSELRARLKDTSWHVLAEIDWRIDESTVVRPDAVVLAGQIPERHVEETPILVAEITSESTGEKDRTAKFKLYQQQCVPNYWLIDPAQRSLNCFVLNDSKEYELAELADGCLSFAGPNGEPIRIESNIFD